MDTLPKRLKEARAAITGLSQDKLARLIGVTPQSVSLMERGSMGPSAQALLRLAHVLKRDPFWLFPDWSLPGMDTVSAERVSAESAPAAHPSNSTAIAIEPWIEVIFSAADLRTDAERAAARVEIDKVARGDISRVNPDVVLLCARLAKSSVPRSQGSPSDRPSAGTKRKRGGAAAKRSR